MTCGLATQPLILYKGTDVTLRLTITDEDGARVDITGWGLELEVKTKAGALDPADIIKSVGAGITILAQSGATLGQADIAIVPDDTKLLTAQVYKYDVVAIDLAGERQVVVPPSDFDLLEVVNIAP